MRHYHKMLLRMLPGPILAWLGMLMFLLVMQFLIKYLPDLVGKGLPLSVIIELVAYNLAYMLVLAVPMSVLIASLMSFGKLSESGAYAVIKSSGVSFPQLVWPVLLTGVLMTGAMGYFNNVVLPEANFRARNLWQDIRVARPGFALRPGVFYDGVEDYKILVRHIPPERPNELRDITVYDYSEGPRNRTDIKAEYGRIDGAPDGSYMDMLLFQGEIHRKRPSTRGSEDRYERLAFLRHRMRISLEDLDFERSDVTEGRRTDRTMRTIDMVRIVDSLDLNTRTEQGRIAALFDDLGDRDLDELQPPRDAEVVLPQEDLPPYPTARIALSGLDSLTQRAVYASTLTDVRTTRNRLETSRRAIEWAGDRADRYRVEIHKKYSIAAACLIFMLIGIPIGVSMRRGGLGASAIAAVFIFMFYWVTLVNGEKLADRGYLTPWIGMWAANMVGGLAGLLLMIRVSLDRRATLSPIGALIRRFRRND